MKIIQISDLHINSDIEGYDYKIKKLCESINANCTSQEKTIFICCGDITDVGKKSGYNNANKLFKLIKEQILNKEIVFEFVPGNHDLCGSSFKDIDKFIKDIEVESSYNTQSLIIKDYDEILIAYLNSTYHKDFKFGSIDIEELKKSLADVTKPIIIVMHHSIINREKSDHSAIVDAYELIKLIENKNIIALMHGHVHAYSDIVIGERCKVIGVGPFFKPILDINNQYNLINIGAGKVQQIDNYRYNKDLDNYNKINIYKNRNYNIFNCETCSEAYSEVVTATEYYGSIPNLRINVQTTLDEFTNDLKKHFSNDIKNAKEWQSEYSDKYYYTHGQYMMHNHKNGLEYIIEELHNKASSSRAIIPLITLENVITSGDNFLPSLDIIQCGFNDESKTELFCTLYLRALEVSQFLRINISEIYLLCSKISEKIRSIVKLNITIYSFRAQYKQNFSCFERAQLDIIEENALMKIVMKRDYDNLILLLEEKLRLSETVVQTSGIDKLYRCLRGENESYPQNLVSSCEQLYERINDLKEETSKTSNYRKIKEKEDVFKEEFKKVITMFKELKDGDHGH